MISDKDRVSMVYCAFDDLDRISDTQLLVTFDDDRFIIELRSTND